MAKILYCEPVTPALHELLEEYKPAGFDLCYWQMLNTEAREAALAEADYLMVAACKVTAAMLAKAAKLRFIQKNGAGYDNIDIEAARQQGIPVANTPGGNLSAVAELTIGLILALYRKLPLLDRTTKNGDWLMWDYRPFSFEMSGKVHGIIGFGNIGREVARLSRAFGTEILY